MKLSIYDYLVIGLYFAFIMAAGVLFRRLSKNTSDYFRAGGSMPWWITGAALFMGFSAWTFTAAAGQAYHDGTFVLVLYLANVVGYVTVFFLGARRLRRLRVITWMEAVYERYGRPTQQFYTWVKLPLLILLAGVGLNAVAVFMSAVFGVGIVLTLIVCGGVITLVSFAGGAWAVAANDFIQMFLIAAITAVAAVLALRQPAVGGISGFIHKVPSYYFDWTAKTPAVMLFGWMAAMLLLNMLVYNSIEMSPKYLMVRSDREARRMVLIPIIGLLLAPVLWLLPAMTAIITHPNLHAEFPKLQHPSEAAYVAVCLDTMPRGLIGLLVSGIFAATITSMDAVLNQGVGVLVRNFYLPIMNPQCGERRLLVVSKVLTLVFGALITAVGLVLSTMHLTGLFDLTNQLAASLTLPLTLPLVYGLFYLRTPGWAAWSTALVSLAAALALKIESGPLLRLLFPLLARQHNANAQADGLFILTTVGVILIGTAWFFLTGLFYRASSPEHQARIEKLRANLRTPVDPHVECISDHRPHLYLILGRLSTAYGVAVMLFAFIPNPISGRVSFIFCGGVLLVVGLLLLKSRRRLRRTIRAVETPEAS